MSFTIVNLVSEMFITVFGNPYIVALILTGFFILLLMALRADLSVILIVMIPFFIGIGVNAATTNIINLPTWIIITMFMIAGIVFSTFIVFLWR